MCGNPVINFKMHRSWNRVQSFLFSLLRFSKVVSCSIFYAYLKFINKLCRRQQKLKQTSKVIKLLHKNYQHQDVDKHIQNLSSHPLPFKILFFVEASTSFPRWKYKLASKLYCCRIILSIFSALNMFSVEVATMTCV